MNPETIRTLAAEAQALLVEANDAHDASNYGIAREKTGAAFDKLDELLAAAAE